MSFPRYPKYKDCGLEWLGKVPEHWEVLPLSSVASERHEPNLGMVEDNLLSLSYGRIVRKNLAANEGLLPESFETYQIVRPGDLVLRLTDLQNDKRSLRSALVEEVGIITSAYVAVTPHRVHPRYLSYLLRAYDASKVFYSMGGGLRQSMKFADLKRLGTLLPPRHEQAAIAAFLDGETSMIDTLVAEQERLIELLKERRQTVISHAVTKGLKPDAPVKPSGIEWLDTIPIHWDVTSLKHLAGGKCGVFTDGDWIETPFITDEGVRLLQTGNVGIGTYKEQGYRYVSDDTFSELRCTEVMPGDVLICRLDGPVGRACLAPALGVRMITSVDNTILRVTNDVLADYVVALLSSVPWLSWTEALCRVGGGFRLRISRSMLGEMRVPLPPCNEQEDIVTHIKSETSAADQLMADAERAITLLQERRSALISAAVTGKIDVRGLVGAEAT
jgi:type I restriction enzyme, S subunit